MHSKLQNGAKSCQGVVFVNDCVPLQISTQADASNSEGHGPPGSMTKVMPDGILQHGRFHQDLTRLWTGGPANFYY